jgi:hypothetical protein
LLGSTIVTFLINTIKIDDQLKDGVLQQSEGGKKNPSKRKISSKISSKLFHFSFLGFLHQGPTPPAS